MGFLRGALVFILALVLFLSLFLANAFLNFNWALEHNTLKPNLQSYTENLVNETGITNGIQQTLPAMELYCMTHTNYIFIQDEFQFEIPCTVVDSGANKIISYGISDLIDQIYYEKYDCDFWNCVKESNRPWVLISEKAKNYWFDKFKLAILIAVGAFALLILFARDRKWAIMLGGIMTMLSAFLFGKAVKFVLSLFFDKIPGISALNIINIFLSKSQPIFIIMMIIGGLILLAGILLKFFKAGFSFSKIFKKKEKSSKIEQPETLSKKDIQDAVKEAMDPSKKKKSKKKMKKAEKGYLDLGKK